MKLNLNLHLDPKNAKSTKFSYLYNQLIQAWSMLCFVAAAAGGVCGRQRAMMLTANPPPGAEVSLRVWPQRTVFRVTL